MTDLVERLNDLRLKAFHNNSDKNIYFGALSSAFQNGELVPATALEAKDKELAELREENGAVSNAIGSVRFMDPPDGGSVSLAEQVERMRVALETAEQAIEDAALIVERYSLPTIQTPSIWLIDKAAIAAEIRALRAARAITGEKP